MTLQLVHNNRVMNSQPFTSTKATTIFSTTMLTGNNLNADNVLRYYSASILNLVLRNIYHNCNSSGNVCVIISHVELNGTKVNGTRSMRRNKLSF